MEIRSDKPRTGNLPKEKLKHLTSLPSAFPVRNHQASSFGSTVNITALHPRVTKPQPQISIEQLYPGRLWPSNDSRKGPVAQISDRGTRALVVVKEGTGVNTARTPDTETNVEGMKIDNGFSDLSNDYTIQEFEFEKGNNYPSVKRRLVKKLFFGEKHFQLIPRF